MIDIAVHELNKYYGSNHVIKGVTFEINSGEKVGLLGRNGSGKTTLFKVIAGDEYYESGSVSKASGKNIGVLAQIPDFKENDTVEDILNSSFSEALCTYEEMKRIEGDSNPEVLAEYGELMEKYELLGGYDIEVKIDKICNGMNISKDMRGSLFGRLSGGEKTRVNLARILLLDCKILLLDEPTNHLDLASLEWLEKFLREFSGTVLVISHDRAFLDNVINRVIEIDEGKLNFYSGNYSFYVEERAQRFLTQSELYRHQQREIKRIEARAKWFLENDRFTTKHKVILGRIDRMEKIEKPVTIKRVTEEFNSGGYAAKELVAFEAVDKRYGANVLMEDISITIRRNDSIALIGENGCGKTTLIKMLMGDEACDGGLIKVSSNARVAYMSQIIEFDDENATVLETLRRLNGLPEDKVRSILAGFRFNSADVMKKVSNLSGGERSRLKLCLLMQSKVNFLILDEPTNHLDIESREWIEEAVSDFDGTKLFISHDRFFLNKFASRIWIMKDGAITDFYGGFDELVRSAADAVPPQVKTISEKKKKKSPVKEKAVVRKPDSLIPIEERISKAEAEIESINAELEMASAIPDYHEMDRLFNERQRLEGEIEDLYGEWMELE